MSRFWAGFAGIVLLGSALFGCVSSGTSVKPGAIDPPYKTGKVRTASLILSLKAADRVRDDSSRFFLYDRIIGVCLEAGLEKEGAEVLSYTAKVLQLNSDRDWFDDFIIVLARRYIQFRGFKQAENLLRQTLKRIETFRESRRKLLLFEEIISTCLIGGELFLPLLRQTVDAVLVLDETDIKTELLIESARRFFDVGFIKDTNDLVQLTLSQVGSLGSPWEKAEIYSRVALVYRLLKDERRTREYVLKAVGEIDGKRASGLSVTDAARIGSTAKNLYSLAFVPEALNTLESVEYPFLRAETLGAIGTMSRKQTSGNIEYDLVDRAFEVAASITEDVPRLTALFQLDLLLLESGETGETLSHFPLREAELSVLRPVPELDGLTARLARLYSLAGETEDAVRIAMTIRDAYNQVSTLIEIAITAVREGKLDIGFPLLDECFRLSLDAETSRSRLFQDLCSAYLLGGKLEAAVDSAVNITEPYSYAAALTEIMKYHFEKVLPFEDDIRLRLEKVLTVP
jgi:hypothetical protein